MNIALLVAPGMIWPPLIPLLPLRARMLMAPKLRILPLLKAVNPPPEFRVTLLTVSVVKVSLREVNPRFAVESELASVADISVEVLSRRKPTPGK